MNGTVKYIDVLVTKTVLSTFIHSLLDCRRVIRDLSGKVAGPNQYSRKLDRLCDVFLGSHIRLPSS